MPRDDAQKRVSDKIADACREPDERYAGMGEFFSPLSFGDPEAFSPLDRPTRDEEVTQRFYESPRRDRDGDYDDGE